MHIVKMKEVMATHGDNLKLIRLYTSEGVGDIAMLAYVLAERDTPNKLFSESYTLVTQDKELCTVAKSYGIPCLADL
jgi:rRNA-processing protein FCF1